MVHPEIIAGQQVPLRAVGFSAMNGERAAAPGFIHGLSHRLQVVRVDAGSVNAGSPARTRQIGVVAQVIHYISRRNLANQFSVQDAMCILHPTIPREGAVTGILSGVPHPAVRFGEIYLHPEAIGKSWVIKQDHESDINPQGGPA